MEFKRGSLSLVVAALIPLGDSSQWQDLAYSKIPKNTVSFAEDGIRASVASSASPLIHALPSIVVTRAIRAEIEIKGTILPPAAGASFEDDSVFRFGLVLEGRKKLGPLQRLVAPEWVKKLFSVAPKGSGIDRILFLGVARQAENKGRSRIHPASDLIEERLVWLRDETSPQGAAPKLQLEQRFDQPLRVGAVWLSMDGDDTKSTFDVVVRKVELITEDEPPRSK